MATFSIPSTVRAICFDAVGTLIYPSPNAVKVYAEAGRAFGSRCTLSEIKARFSEAFQVQEDADKSNDWTTSPEREVQRWRQIVADVFDDLSPSEDCFQQLWQHFAEPNAWALFDDVPSTLSSLIEGGYIVAIASNFDARLRKVVAGHPALNGIEHLFISAEMGRRKPSSHFFQYVRRHLGLDSANILFIGDDLANDFEGATADGMPTVLISRDGKHEGLSSLTELRPR
ncbi:MAG: HAD-IA family hydrolase [Gemmataceae bacterium]